MFFFLFLWCEGCPSHATQMFYRVRVADLPKLIEEMEWPVNTDCNCVEVFIHKF